ncbi:MAG: MATE family efflux transporter [Propionibacteriaceae bacterium]|jgi:putative MATE family efflux protein|nr:MATE family efflux transporter [Propionibacteriaceae bacterium]
MAKNLSVGEPTKLIVLFTLPLLVGNLFQQLYQFTDAVVVGRVLGVDALASVGAAGSLMFLLLGFTFGSSNGVAIPIARAFGAGDLSAMRRAVAAGVVVSAGIALAIMIIGLIFAKPLLGLLNTPDDLIPNAHAFLAIAFCGTAVTVAYNFLAATIRALGDSRTPLIFLIIACVLNAALVYVFIAVFGLGVGGASAATVVAQIVSVALCLLLIAKKMPDLHLHRDDFRLLTRSDIGESTRMGLAMGFQLSVIAIGAVILQYAINGLGQDAMAAFTASMRVDQVAVAPLSSFGVAIATFVAQNRGARQWRRIRVGVFRISLVSSGASILLGVVIWTFGTDLVRLFVGDGEEDVVAMGHQYLVINSVLYIILAMLFLLRNAVQGMGRTSVPTIASVMELILRAGAGLFLVVPLGFLGVCVAAPLAWVGALIPVGLAWFAERRQLIRREESVYDPVLR